MKSTVSIYDFRQAFHNCGRGDQFSYDALTAIFEYLEEYEDSCDTELELDPIAICCEYAEQDWDDIALDYDIDLTDCEDEDDKIAAVREHLEENTSVVAELTGGVFVYQQY